jgi:4-azaleucine resistance transporter AzlC
MRGDGPAFRSGLVASLPLVPSVFVYATVFGGLAVQAGLRPVEAWAMSLFVFAGASQFVAVPMIAAGVSPLVVIVTTYVVNMRHYLMAATLAPSFRAFPRAWLLPVAHGINDESFAIATARRSPPDPWTFIGSVVAIMGAFFAGVPVGTELGGLVRDPERWGLDFAFPAVFLSLVAVQLRRRADWLVAVAAASLGIAIATLVPGNWHVVLAGLTVSAAAAAVLPVESDT